MIRAEYEGEKNDTERFKKHEMPADVRITVFQNTSPPSGKSKIDLHYALELP
jgi:hypothetical protein